MEQVGLLKPSVARVHRLTTMLQADLMTARGAGPEKCNRDPRLIEKVPEALVLDSAVSGA